MLEEQKASIRSEEELKSQNSEGTHASSTSLKGSCSQGLSSHWHFTMSCRQAEKCPPQPQRKTGSLIAIVHTIFRRDTSGFSWNKDPSSEPIRRPGETPHEPCDLYPEVPSIPSCLFRFAFDSSSLYFEDLL